MQKRVVLFLIILFSGFGFITECSIDDSPQSSNNFSYIIKQNFIQGCQQSVKLIMPTVVVTSVVMLMVYKPYQSLYQSVHHSTLAFDGMREAFEEISHSFKEIKGSMEGSKKAFDYIGSSLADFVHSVKTFFSGVGESRLGSYISKKG